jgi:dihydrolipoamide dehydrogenase
VAHGAAAKFGVKTGPVELDLPVLMGEKATAVKELTGGIEFLFKKNKIDWLKGYAQFKDAHTVDVAGTTYTAKHIVIATGSSVMPLPNVDVDNDAGIIVDSTGALALESIPEHLVVIGGGVIGLELGSVWRRLGAKVTVVEFLDQLCPAWTAMSARKPPRSSRSRAWSSSCRPRSPAQVEGKTVTLDIEPLAALPSDQG